MCPALPPDRVPSASEVVGGGDDGACDARNCWTLAETAGEPNPYRFQHLLSRAKWDDAAVRAKVRSAVWEGLSASNGVKVLVVDETGDIKKGEATVGVQRQYSGTAGKIENCQLVVFLALACEQGHAVIDTRLYLPGPGPTPLTAGRPRVCLSQSDSRPNRHWPGR